MFRSDCSAYKPDMLLFIDENGTDRRHSLRKFGYSLVGKPALPTSACCCVENAILTFPVTSATAER